MMLAEEELLCPDNNNRILISSNSKINNLCKAKINSRSLVRSKLIIITIKAEIAMLKKQIADMARLSIHLATTQVMVKAQLKIKKV